MADNPKRYVDLAGLTEYDELLKNYITDSIPDLSELDSVSIENPTNNQAMVYDEETEKWENKPVLTGATVSNETLVLT